MVPEPTTPRRTQAARSSSVSAHTASVSTASDVQNRYSPRKRSSREAEAQLQPSSARLTSPSRQRGHNGGFSSGEQMRRLLLGMLERWRWLLPLALAAGVLLVAASREPERPPLVIPKPSYALQPYRHLDFSRRITLKPATRVLHVSKEFGPATMGGLGVMLTALTIAQSESPYVSVSVVLPYYSYLRERDLSADIEPFTTLSIPITLAHQRVKHIHCPVSLLRWQYSPAVDFLNPHLNRMSAAEVRSIDVYLIGPGTEKPFHVAFKAKDEGDIYSAYKPLKQEWKDLYYAKAVSELVAYLSTFDETTVFEVDDSAEEPEEDVLTSRRGPKRAVDVVQLHGATNAVVAFYLRQLERMSTSFRHCHPAIVYTLHDSLDEVEYSNLVSNAVTFLPPRSNPPATSDSLALLQPYIYRSGTQIFTSALGIDLADTTTFVSHSIASDIVTGRFRFHLQDLVMPSIAHRASRGAFIGVTNGLDFTEQAKNPFTSPALVERGLSFPRVGPDVQNKSTYYQRRDGRFSSAPDSAAVAFDPLLDLDDLPPPSALSSPVSFASAKDRAKTYLVRHAGPTFSLSSDDLSRPWFLFIGRFQYNKGCQFFETLLDVLSSSPISGRLFVLGARNNYPYASLRSLASRYPRHVTLIDDVSSPGLQAQWGPLIRMASDMAFVPSLSEAFGLVAAEALLFGTPVLSTGIGGLTEFLVPFPPVEATGGAEERANSYLFDLFPTRSMADTRGAEEDYSRSAQDVRPDDEQLEPARAALRKAAEQALRDWKRRRNERDWEVRETFVRRMVSDALRLKWDREKGPVEEYIRVYDLALDHRRRKLGIPAPMPPPPSERRSASPPRLEHPVAVPNIASGGHDQVSGADGVAHLRQETEDGSRIRALHQLLPVYKVYRAQGSSSEREKKAAAAKTKQASAKTKRALRRKLSRAKARRKGSVAAEG
ncbi:hypothetical protein JCM1841_006051 [Sporobolomyces salmonicolor]